MSLSNAEIAERLDGMKRRGVSVERGIGNTMAVCKVFPHKDGVFQVIKLPFLYSSDLLAFCRAVVERVDGERFTIPEILSATTARHRKEQG